MSMKKFFIALLAMILCFSMLLTACGDADKDKEKDDEEKENETEAGSSDEKQFIIDKIADFNIKNILDTAMSNLESGNLSSPIGNIFEEISKLSVESDLDLTFAGETGNIYAGLKDNAAQIIVKSPTGDEEAVYAIIKDGEIFGFTPESNGAFSVEGSGNILEMNELILGNMDMSEITNELDSILTDEIMNVLGEFKFPELKKDDLVKEGDFYYIKDTYYSKVAENVLDFVIDIMDAAGAAAERPSEAELDSVLTMINEIIDMANLKIGFAAGKNGICGFAVSVDLDVNAVAAYLNGSAVSDEPSTVKFAVEMLATKDLKAPKYLHATADIDVDGVSADITANIDAILTSGNEFRGFDINVKANISNATIEGFGKGTASSTPDGSSNSTYVYTNILGNINVALDAKIDFSDIEAANAKLVDFKLDANTVATKAESHDDYGNEVATDEIDLADYGMTMTASGNVTVKSKGSATIGFNFSMTEEGYKNDIILDGTINWLSAPNFKPLPSDVSNATSSDFASKYNSTLEHAENIRSGLYDPNNYEDDWRSYLWYDSATGLYVILWGEYEGDLTVYTQAPPAGLYDYKAQ